MLGRRDIDVPDSVWNVDGEAARGEETTAGLARPLSESGRGPSKRRGTSLTSRAGRAARSLSSVSSRLGSKLGILRAPVVSPSLQGRKPSFAVLSVALATAATLAIAPVAGAAKYYDSSTGVTSATPAYGGTFSGVGDVAVNDSSITTDGTSQSGWLYVADRFNNRIQAFDANKNFQFAVGRDVIASSVNDQQRLTVTATAGQYRLEFNGQVGVIDVNFNATAATVDNALDALVGGVDANVTVSGGPGSASGSSPYVITFAGALAAADQPAITVLPGTTPLTGTAVVANLADGAATTADTGAGFEKCTVAAHCKAGVAGVLGGEFLNAEGIDVDQATGHFLVVDRGNRRTQEFTADGAFVRAFGWDVVAPGGPGGSDINEQKTITLDPNASGGAFTLTVQPVPFGASATTGPIASEASADDVEAALNLLSLIGPGGTDVTGPAGGPWNVEFTGGLADTNVNSLTINGAGLSAVVGAQLACSSSTTATTTSFQWLSNGVPATGPGATTASYTTVAADAGKAVQCQVTKLNANAGSIQASNPATIVSPAPGSAAPTAPSSIASPAGTAATAGQVLTCNAGSWANTPTSYTYQWYRNGVAIGTPATTVLTSSTYTLTAADIATPAVFQCSVTAANLSGATTKFSQNKATAAAPTGPGAPSPAAPPSNTSSPNAAVPALSATVATTQEGSDALETCNAAAGDICQSAAATGSQPGQLGAGSGEHGIAVAAPGAPNAGQVLLTDPGNRRLLPFTVPVGPTAAVSAGAPIAPATEFEADQPTDVTLDAAGIAYVIAGGTGGPVTRYDTGSAQFLSPISLATLTGNTNNRSGVEIDRGTGNLFVVSSSATAGLFEIATPGATPSLAGVYPTAFTANFTPIGLGVNPGAGTVFMPTSTSGQRVVAFDDDGLGPIQIGLQPATNVQATTADLHATINPAVNGPTGQPASYRFEVSEDGLSWTPVTSSAQVPPNGDTNVAQPVQAEATGLKPNTFYRVRVVATRASNSGAAISAELFFLTDPASPIVETLAAQHVSDTTAQLVGRLNPGGLSTSYWFEWGDDSYGNVTPVPAASAGDGGVAKFVIESLTDLDPESQYHFRLCAQNTLTAEPVCGDDRILDTRTAASASSDAGRVYEMATSPDKVLRRGGPVAGDGLVDIFRFNPAFVAHDGAKLMTNVFGSALDPNAGHEFAADTTWERRVRAADGWRGEALLNVPPPFGASAYVLTLRGLTPDLSVAHFESGVPLFANGSQAGTRVFGDTGGPRGAGMYPLEDSAWYGGTTGLYRTGERLLTDHGDRSLLYFPNDALRLRDFKGLDDALAPNALTPPQTSGQALFTSGPPTWGPRDMVNECSGSGATATELPSRDDAGTPGVPADDTIGSRPCGQGAPTDVRGAAPGGNAPEGATYLGSLGVAAMTMSESGDRIFFQSPDPNALGTGIDQNVCGIGTGAATRCPPQLFVRQYDDSGQGTVRWISRAAAGVGPQGIAAFGDGAIFEGASSDGRVVYFRTNAPLTADDPNAGQPLASAASRSSWDLYRYVLPADRDQDPTGPQAGGLTRISAGPDGDADPATNVAGGGGAATRFVSDSGDRVYFVTSSRIGDSDDPWNRPSAGGSTTADGAVANADSRNLYLYDDTKSGADAYKFVARIPYADPSGGAAPPGIEHCAASSPNPGRAPRGTSTTQLVGRFGSCVHGTSSGDAIVFETTGRLTPDDTDTAGDVYLYEAEGDRLTRITAPPADSQPYYCLGTKANPTQLCNGDLGINKGSVAVGGEPGLTRARHTNIAEYADGRLRAVVFESRLPLVEADANDTMDVYEWHDGRLSLVSPGTSDDSAFYVGGSRDGRDVFFWTEQRISAWEIDPGDGDIYNATLRPDRLPAAPPPAPVVCGVLAGGCHGAGAGATPVAVRTAGPTSEGNADAGERKTLGVSWPASAKARRAAARRGALTLTVRMNEPGSVSAVARSRIAGRMRTVARRSIRMRTPGSTRLTLSLSRAARARLRSGRPLRVVLRVSSPGARTRATTIRLPGAGS